ncbi:MAG: extracellular solute-binding protein [Oscillospiraceae bacterium]|nr:extracellular solute-binding protein [Oscillospiraceae bacterium]
MKKRTFSWIALLALVVTLCAGVFSGCDNGETGDTGTPGGPQLEETDINLPEVELDNKKVSIFVQSDSIDDYRMKEDGKVGWVEIAEQQYGMSFDVVSYVDSTRRLSILSALYMSGEMPDYVGAADYPICLANNYLEPLENYIDLDDVMWKDVRPMMDTLKWKDHYYFLVTKPLEFDIWCVWNPEILAENNVTSPLTHFENNTWDWDALKDIAVTVTRDDDGDGTNDVWGLGIDGAIYPLHFSTGVNLLEVDNENGDFILNIGHEKIAAAAEWFATLGPLNENVLRIAGTGDMTSADLIAEFVNGKVAMMLISGNAAGQASMIELWEKGRIDFCPTPQWMGEGQYYTYAQPSCAGIGAGCKNPEGGALIAQIMRYVQTDAYYDKYHNNTYKDRLMESDYKTVWKMTDSQIDRLVKMREIAYNSTPIPFIYYNFWGFDDGFIRNLTANSWSSVVESVVPVAESSIEDWLDAMNKVEE